MQVTLKNLNEVIETLNKADLDKNTEKVLAVPAIYLSEAKNRLNPDIAVSAQNVYGKNTGAFTGEIAPTQLKDFDVKWTLTGHSERRHIFKENDDDVAHRTQGALNEGVNVIFCIGEKLDERESGKTKEVVEHQLNSLKKDIGNDWSKIVIAYEPVWAIGTGKVATPEIAQEAHADIRQWLKSNLGQDAADTIRVIYGGSVSHTNCGDLSKQPDIDGFLVGGASIKPEFVQIINSNRKIA
ncbi:triosephosphate isomerase [Wallemia mellicola]|uniref:Triosephosphate isomerase n=1 Tax=Wallemia mellicola TaxID=1708541 RepID=A0A4T0T169_9BASI|nr:hypothetical protein E3Q24_04180 [Wallemia mellicola]TIB73941.1 triosephosphate isomerase [Wallemia mellicola]TIC11871.1 triosephosphate isomerase [Wallemia mellicola]TIC19544.1 triosephosphate isomerase [Wallemia mellicola]TIC48432.1 triosephosphate isomerase [Wallemia mellicola]